MRRGSRGFRRDVRALEQLCEGEHANDVAQGEVLVRMHSYLVAGRVFLSFIRESFGIGHTTAYRRMDAYRRTLEVLDASADAPAGDNVVSMPHRAHVPAEDRLRFMRLTYGIFDKQIAKLGSRARKPGTLEVCAYLLARAGITEATTITPLAAPDEVITKRGRPAKIAA